MNDKVKKLMDANMDIDFSNAGFGNSQWIDGYASYILSGNLVVILLSFFFLTSLGSLILRELKKRSPLLHDTGRVLYNVGILALSVSLML